MITCLLKFCLFVLRLNVPANNFSVMSGQTWNLTISDLNQLYNSRIQQVFLIIIQFCPFQDYFSSYETDQAVGGGKPHMSNPQAELGTSHMPSLSGTQTNTGQGIELIIIKLNHLATGVARASLTMSHEYYPSNKKSADHLDARLLSFFFSYLQKAGFQMTWLK